MDGLRWLPYLNVPKWLIPAAHQGAIQANPVAGWLNTGGQVRRNCQLRLLDKGERISCKNCISHCRRRSFSRDLSLSSDNVFRTYCSECTFPDRSDAA